MLEHVTGLNLYVEGDGVVVLAFTSPEGSVMTSVAQVCNLYPNLDVCSSSQDYDEHVKSKPLLITLTIFIMTIHNIEGNKVCPGSSLTLGTSFSPQPFYS